MALRLAVVGHAEWVTFARVDRLPEPGEIVHATKTWEDPGGGGGIAAVLLAAMSGGCAFFTAVGRDGLGEALRARGVTVHTGEHAASRRIFTHLDGDGERTITVLGRRLDPSGDDGLPWELLERADGVFVTAGDVAALRAARAARVLVATPRAGEALAELVVDALVWSAHDAVEAAAAERVANARLRVRTRGADGGTWTAADGTSGAWAATELPGSPVDAFGCGDAFAAALTLGLAADRPLDAALDVAARCGAAALTGPGPYGAIDRMAAATAGLR